MTLLLLRRETEENSREIPLWAGVRAGLLLAGRAAWTRGSLPPEPWGMPKLGRRTDLKQSRYGWVRRGGESTWVSDAEMPEAQIRGSPAWGLRSRILEQDRGQGG